MKFEVVATPLTVEVRVIALVELAAERALLEMTELVAVMPLIVVVRVLPLKL